MKLTTAIFVAVAAFSVALAQEDELAAVKLPPVTLRPITLPPPPSDVCLPDSSVLSAADADASDADREDEASDDDSSDSAGRESPDSLAVVPTTVRCEDGPVRKLFTLPGEFYWPPIYRSTCDDLKCDNPPCIARKSIWRARCVLVYRFIKGCWRRIGFRTRRYLDHLECSCKNCEDIRNRADCVTTHPCPNSKDPRSFCFWKFHILSIGKRQAPTTDALIAPVPFGKCACCVPFLCHPPKLFNNSTCSCVCPSIKCPPGRILNPVTCRCDCPRGTKDIHGKCIGDCDDLTVGVCPHIHCEDNPHQKCVVKGHKCTCPSCDANKDARWCMKAKCLELPGKPGCVYDKNECRCPMCSDFTDREKCVQTKPCPESNNTRTFCIWKPTLTNSTTPGGKCSCCTPTTCPPGQTFNRDTCRCECPNGTKNMNGKCIGDCDALPVGVCPHIFCEDNPHQRCRVKDYKCVCPSCDANKDARWCMKAKCLELPGKPGCVYDKNKCRCPMCSDFTDREKCVQTKPCPESNNTRTFCIWKPTLTNTTKGECSCCTPTTCPPGQTFNRDTCQCECPKGTKNVNGKCIGDCDALPVGVCPHIFCEDNPHLRCRVKDYKCVCPSCDANKDALWCMKAKCLELPGKPGCVYDRNECRCPVCSDFTDREKCVQTKPCPESNNTRTFCIWKPTLTNTTKGECSCCTPTTCPPGQTFNRATCKCECPKGTKNVNGKCIGDCDALPVGVCPHIFCEDNPHQRCRVKDYKCVCPSCDANKDALWCMKAKCLELPGKPGCVYDKNKCRCPMCSDFTDREKCVQTKPCPESNNTRTFCIWKPTLTNSTTPGGECSCCTPTTCPPGQTFNRDTCRCECPKGTKNVNGKCIGDCDALPVGVCPHIFCEDNPHQRCRVKDYKCVCPSCDANKDALWCMKAKCLELPGKPGCVYDKNECRCPMCSDFTDREKCVQTKPCPESNNTRTFCIWKPTLTNTTKGECSCCTPTTCPPGQTFNRATCQCECPKGTKNVNGKCIGDCEALPVGVCPHIFCEDNPHQRCRVKDYKCVCPSCDANNDAHWCMKAKCLELPGKPGCVYDKNKCRCPMCSDFTDREKCVQTKPCPESNNTRTFCIWKPTLTNTTKGECSCCTPTTCPPGQTFNRDTCRCECPKGTKNVNGKCIGDCDALPVGVCPHIFCEDNPHQRCRVKDYKCVCPSCDANKDALWCMKAKCLELPGKPGCVYDKNECRCPMCSDFTDREKCVQTKPCPESNNTRTFCIWKPTLTNSTTPGGECSCCTPTTCPPGQTFNRDTCRCECPKGTKNVNGKCIGDCEALPAGVCPHIFCEDNPHQRCRVKDYKCVCPSCDANKDAHWCMKAKCLELPGKPGCVYDRNECRCPVCSDFTDREKCVQTKPCPESNNTRTFCIWKPTLTNSTTPGGECSCCTPTTCPRPKVFDKSTCSCVCPAVTCPPGRVFNPVTCGCDCPKGTTEVDGKCIADCSELPLGLCPNITCKDSPMFKCVVKDHQCVCPSCEASTEPRWCKMTKCQEQPGKPKCVVDSYSGKCRCPQCSDHTEKEWCVETYCGKANSLRCKFENYRCSCPH